ncbi:aromatic ring-opening dioxygenase catalytic subunit (LigB family) [Rhizomicrobium palustre]|uniref:Aromatic ring-opening dioxygenase catalytic subunit (LigB family) n=1 Tax=Rhizomicrobium palustre TaxID=189966 RepID=A0A846N1W2_9PROT|nr:class III extradiol ring-cleavage dioxygenase [Rhizomicrobium palustre]NIK89202.1 aromatic ring-opening dioxygenase catalytic subunit (LigB family) [Rhizomicrobium palustre]
MRQPSFFIPHGGGPCFFMPDPQGIWTGMGQFLARLPELLPEQPKALLVVSGHWEADGFALTSGAAPELIYDYYGFPRHTYELTFPAPGTPDLAAQASGLLKSAGFSSSLDPRRGFDHGVFVPLKVAFPKAEIPIVQMSLDAGLDPALHIKAGEALKPLRDEGVVIIGSGMSFHNMRGYGNPNFTAPSKAFDEWLTAAVTSPAKERAAALTEWAKAPAARASHPREEHLIPLMVAAGTSDAPGEKIYGELVLGTAISAFKFG